MAISGRRTEGDRMRLTTRTDLAMRALMYCAHHYPQIQRKVDIAQACEVNENHLAQVIHVLGVRGFLATKRGRQGGVTLARPAAEIAVGAVFRALEAEVPFATCFDADGGQCPLKRACGLRCVLARAVNAFYETLDEVTLDTLLGDELSFGALFEPLHRPVVPALGAPSAETEPEFLARGN